MLGMSCRVLQLSQLRMHSKRRRSWTTLTRGVLTYPLKPIANSKPSLFFRSGELLKALRALKADPSIGPHILDIRGQGLMIAVEFASPSRSTFDPAVKKGTPANLAMKLSKRCLEKGLLLLTTSVYETVRFIPPLNTLRKDLATGIDIFAESVKEIVKEA